MPRQQNNSGSTRSHDSRPRFSKETFAESYAAEMSLVEASPESRRRGLLTYREEAAGRAHDDTRNGHTPNSIAQLTVDEVARMETDEMLEVIRLADFPIFSSDDLRRLRFAERRTLERLVYLARECCLNRECWADQSQRRMGSGEMFKWFGRKPK